MLLCALALLHGRLSPQHHKPWVALVILVGIGSLVHGAHRNRLPRGSGWWRFVAGCSFYATGDLCWVAVTAVLGPEHVLATVAWTVGLLGLPVAIDGIRRVFATGEPARDRETQFDAAIITLAMAYLAWHAMVGPMIQRDGLVSYGVLGVSAYLLCTFSALGLALSRGLRGGGTPTVWLLCAAIPVTALTSVVYWTAEASYAWESAPTARVLMAFSYALAGAAVWHPSMRSLAVPAVADAPVWARLALVAAAASVVPLWHAAGSVLALPPPDPVGGLLGLVLTAAAIGRVVVTLQSRDAAQTALHSREALFRTMAENAYDFVLVLDADQTVRWGSHNTGVVTGRGMTQMHGRSFLEEVHPDDMAMAVALFEECVARPGGGVRGSVRVLTVEGEDRWIEFSFSNHLHDPAVQGVVANYRDVSDTQRARQELVHQATHDGLTGLPNRLRLLRHMDEVTACAEGRTAVLFLDLDRFKLVNDSLGHHVGDRLLNIAADRLRQVVGPDDLIARIGGDEFVIVRTDVQSRTEVLDLGARVCQALAEPIHLDGHDLTATASVGIALQDGPASPDDLLRDADTAMYRAKDAGRDGVALFDPLWRGASARRLRIEAILRRALVEGDGLQLHYQPVVSVGTGRLKGFEALLRWDERLFDQEGVQERITTSDLIRIAEECGQIDALGDWVLARACRDLAVVDRWHPAGDLVMAVNVSGVQLRQESFPDRVQRALDDAGLPSERLVVELTESVVVDDVAAARASLTALCGMGVVLAMDDFGTGYSALANLKRIPFGLVKIDRTFVDGVVDDPDAAAIVHAVVGMAHALNISVVAEGVETSAHQIALRAIGCDYVQGWHIGHPMPLDAIRHFVTACVTDVGLSVT